MINRIQKKIIFNKDGLTLVEVIVSIAIFSLIIGATGRFVFSSLNSWNNIQKTSYAISNASNVIIVMEKEVRQAKMPSYEQNAISVFAELDETEAIDKGDRVDIYTDFHGEMTRITYLYYDDAFWRIETDYLSEEPPNSADDLIGVLPLISGVRKLEDSSGNIIPIFKINDNYKQLAIRFEVVNEDGNEEENLFEVNTSYTVRSQGEI